MPHPPDISSVDMATEPTPEPEHESGRPNQRLTPTDFAAHFNESWRTLWCITASVLGRRDEAEDVLQEATVIALQKLDTFDARTSFIAWMAQIVRYVAMNARRRQWRHAARTEPDPSRLQIEPSPVTPTGPTPVTSDGQLTDDVGSFDDRVLTALNTLDETARACLLLRSVEELSYRDISMALDIPQGTAMSHVHRARKAVRAILTEPDDSPPESERNT